MSDGQAVEGCDIWLEVTDEGEEKLGKAVEVVRLPIVLTLASRDEEKVKPDMLRMLLELADTDSKFVAGRVESIPDSEVLSSKFDEETAKLDALRMLLELAEITPKSVVDEAELISDSEVLCSRFDEVSGIENVGVVLRRPVLESIEDVLNIVVRDRAKSELMLGSEELGPSVVADTGIENVAVVFNELILESIEKTCDVSVDDETRTLLDVGRVPEVVL